MRKFLMVGLLMAGLLVVQPVGVYACAKKESSCAKCALKAQYCKIFKLTKEVKMLWAHQDALGITDKQLEQIKTIKHKALKTLIQLKADVDIVKVDLTSAMWQDTMDVAVASRLVEAKYAAKAQSAKTYVKAIGDIQQVLTVDQRAQWKNMKGSQCAQADCPLKSGAGATKVCPLTGKVIGGKGSVKGSMK